MKAGIAEIDAGFYGTAPAGAVLYAIADLRAGVQAEFIAWEPPPAPGDTLCRALTGRREADLVRDILEGKYDVIMGRCPAGDSDNEERKSDLHGKENHGCQGQKQAGG